ncbi:hypothetical protein W97_00883 [Coniosporium apollinis CBS 100218]|uniref:Guanylate cyclase domain-containing protein n=1 Tax=Coniosporium apollinis (strain CBS 100218) TaxID=1168221 RepID=R7YID2_CONA1|nr:uncharacterized protein W97_00883 [Coniosporium apollinis CBS 100218]EON61667.1 hypothetical protein W97_00883 [Coniosporium apollinis CBS 100218]
MSNTNHHEAAESRAQGDTTSASFDAEKVPPAPSGNLSIVFTDIKESTALWETLPGPMERATEMHNRVIRDTISLYGGYEVKVIGDAFMIAFPTAASALLWCMKVQEQLLRTEWPPEILEHTHGKEIRDNNGEIIFCGLSVRMGIHWGNPIAKEDEVTRRKDYIGPMVHRAARALEFADGGHIVVTGESLVELRRELTMTEQEGTAEETGGNARKQA